MKLTSIFGLLSVGASVVHAAPITTRSALPMTSLQKGLDKAVADIREKFGWDRPVQAREALAEPSLDGAIAEIRKDLGFDRPIQAREALIEPILNVDVDFGLDKLPLESSCDISDLKDKFEAGSKGSDVQKREAKFIVGSKPLPAAQIPKFWDFVKDKVKSIVGKGSKRSEMARREASSSDLTVAQGVEKRDPWFIVGAKTIATAAPKFSTFLKNKIKGVFGKGS